MELSSHPPDPTEFYRVAAVLLAFLHYCAFAAVYIGRRQAGPIALAWVATMAFAIAAYVVGDLNRTGEPFTVVAAFMILIVGIPAAAAAAIAWRAQRNWPLRFPARTAVTVALFAVFLLTWGLFVTLVAGYLL